MNSIEPHVLEILRQIDTDVQREGLQRTPARYAKFLVEFTKPSPLNVTVFQNEGYDEMVIQSHIFFYSLCEHHLLPFFGQGTIAYVPGSKIVGLSKLARILEHFSRRLQNQERITTQVADYLMEILQPKGVGTILTGRHLCMEMRGIAKPNVLTSTSALRGIFKTREKTRAEFYHLAKFS